MNSISSPQSATVPYQLPTTADDDAIQALSAYLVQRRLAVAGEPVSLERAGQSNMNCVWRVRLPGRSMILKQARPWVERYPSIAAPVGRAEAEARFYTLAGQDPVLAAGLPRLLDHDSEAHLLAFTDLAPAVTLEVCYAGVERISVEQLDALAGWVGRLHGLAVPAADAAALRNRAMRELNHAHIFELPLCPDGPFDGLLDGLTPGLAAAAGELRADSAYVQQVTALGRRFLDLDRPTLIHGDLFLGSLLRQPSGEIRVIDAEFSFGGDPEFDLGVFYAHLILSGQRAPLCARWLEQTMAARHREHALVLQYAGVEIMRRLIGVAQLPLDLTIEAKRELLALSRKLVNG